MVDGWLARAAGARPEHPALQTPEGALSYAQLYADARAGVTALEGLGAAPGTRVGIALPAGTDFARALHACLLLGAPVVPIDLRLSESEQQRLRQACGLVLGEPLPPAPRAARGGASAAWQTDDGDRLTAASGTATTSTRPRS